MLSAIPAPTSGRIRRWREAVDLRRSPSGWLASVALLAVVT
jgi:hypothetical protein